MSRPDTLMAILQTAKRRKSVMKLPNGYGSVTKLSGKRRKPYIVQKTIKWVIDSDTGKLRQEKATIGMEKIKEELF